MALDQQAIEALVRLAQQEASKAIAEGNPPFGAVLTDADGTVIVTAHNTQNSTMDPTAHAEINLLRAAARKLHTRLFEGFRLFTNAEPCSMCMSACIKARIFHITYGAPHEDHMDPDLPAADVAARAKEPIHLQGGVLAESCIAQIAAARQSSGFDDF